MMVKRGSVGGSGWEFDWRRRVYWILVGSGRNCVRGCSHSWNVMKLGKFNLPGLRTLLGSVTLWICVLFVLSKVWWGRRGSDTGSGWGDRAPFVKRAEVWEQGFQRGVSPRVRGVNEFKGQALLLNPSSSSGQNGKFGGKSDWSDGGGGEWNSRNVEVGDDEGGSGREGGFYKLEKPEVADRMANSSVVNKIMRLFAKADVNKDSLLSGAEVSKWINSQLKEHFSKAMKENFEGFFSIDKDPRNGRVEWNEYLEFYLERIKYSGGKITPESIKNRTLYKQLPKNIKVDIAALEARWSESAQNDPGFLTVDEYLAFNHPEASPSKLLTAVQDTFSTFDLDGDGIITKTEFDTTYAEAEGVDTIYKQDLKLIDTDNNWKITRLELMRYMDPKNMIHSDKEAAKLVSECDQDKDEHLSLEEVFRNVSKIVKTKFYDIDLYFHANQLHS